MTAPVGWTLALANAPQGVTCGFNGSQASCRVPNLPVGKYLLRLTVRFPETKNQAPSPALMHIEYTGRASVITTTVRLWPS